MDIQSEQDLDAQMLARGMVTRAQLIEQARRPTNRYLLATFALLFNGIWLVKVFLDQAVYASDLVIVFTMGFIVICTVTPSPFPVTLALSTLTQSHRGQNGFTVRSEHFKSINALSSLH